MGLEAVVWRWHGSWVTSPGLTGWGHQASSGQCVVKVEERWPARTKRAGNLAEPPERWGLPDEAKGTVNMTQCGCRVDHGADSKWRMLGRKLSDHLEVLTEAPSDRHSLGSGKGTPCDPGFLGRPAGGEL